MNSLLNHAMCELSDDEVNEVNGGDSLGVAGIAVVLGMGAGVALFAGYNAG